MEIYKKKRSRCIRFEKVYLSVKICKIVLLVAKPGFAVKRIGKPQRRGKSRAVNVHYGNARLVEITDIVFRGTEAFHRNGINDFPVGFNVFFAVVGNYF